MANPRPIVWIATGLLACAGAFFLVRLDERGSHRLVTLAEDVSVNATEGSYPIFDDERVLFRSVTLSGVSAPSLTPPFPSRLRFELLLPEAATLELDTALIMMQGVSRARIRFVVTVVVAGERTDVYDERRTLTDANRWQPAKIDLSRWSGQNVALILSAYADPPRKPLWADRVQIVWGDPVVGASTNAVAATIETLDELLDRAASWGAGPAERIALKDYAIALALAGLASLFVGSVYRRLATSSSAGGDLSSGFVLFTMTTTLVVAVLRSSVALSLGLLGALSILRFRSPVRTSEQLLYLLVCLALALSLGTNQRLLALVVIVVFCVAAAGLKRRSVSMKRLFLLTAHGPVAPTKETELLDRIEAYFDAVEVESFEVEKGEVALRARLTLDSSIELTDVVSKMRVELPEHRISFQSGGET